jgi:UDP-glucose 4-epimerase
MVSFEAGVATMLRNLDEWRSAPVWTPDSIATATQSWFRYMSGVS